MEKLSEYRVAFRGLGEGIHTWTYDLDARFFDNFDSTKGTKGALKAEVIMKKSSLLMELTVNLSGAVITVCDRCLGDLELPINECYSVYAKESGRAERIDDDYLVIAPDQDYLDFAELIYQTYIINYPIRIVHPDGECDGDMQEVLDKYLIDEENKPTDPRWDELKKLINN